MIPSAAPCPLATCRTPANPAVGVAANSARPRQATRVSSQAMLATKGYAFPAQVDPSDCFLSYLHGEIAGDRGPQAVSAECEDHCAKAILETLRGIDFAVISEMRRGDADRGVFAARPSGQIEDLLTAGVPSGSITVVGASKGACLAALDSCRPADSGLRSVRRSSCYSDLLQEWATQGITLNRPTKIEGMP